MGSLASPAVKHSEPEQGSWAAGGLVWMFMRTCTHLSPSSGCQGCQKRLSELDCAGGSGIRDHSVQQSTLAHVLRVSDLLEPAVHCGSGAQGTITVVNNKLNLVPVKQPLTGCFAQLL